MKNAIIKSDYQTLIYDFRGLKVMLDFVLAVLYGVETKRLKEQVKRNLSRFPEDFMFELSKEEYDNLRSQFATSSWGGTRYMPIFRYLLEKIDALSIRQIQNPRPKIGFRRKDKD
jgi:hypothetical protein